MERFVIRGGYPLRGEITPSGNKNAAVALLAASLLTDQEVVLHNLPRIRDVLTMLQILAHLGVEIRDSGGHEIVLRAREVKTNSIPPELAREIRASILFLGPLLARTGGVVLPPPGGDVIGRRRVDTHLMALQALGAKSEVANEYHLQAKQLSGQEIFLDEASVTGTENALMTAVLAQGTTTIRNAASEPHVQELANFLNKMGARISGIGSNTLVVDGVDRLQGVEHEIGPDHIEVGSFIAAAAATGGEITIRRAAPQNLRMISLIFRRLGVDFQIQGDDVYIPQQKSPKIEFDVGGAIPKIDDGPWPAFPADLMSMAIVVATQAEGTVLFFEKMFESRLYFVDKLIAMGARLVLADPHRVVVIGPSQLHGATMESPDIRAGMALLIAALCAQGQSIIKNIGQIDRGYERIEERLQKLGARIERVNT
ncbi:MAG: UDP-N-acetylglucosamine 1-carboxyvinyltransferase [Chloroflexi bacterium]|nr:UDP-N-acetylglucosamine 1-carboxyvinyltransferase [Chloroflexota bacterium]